jgi:hypothetical protein
VSIPLAIKLVVLTMIAMVIVNQAPQIVMIVASADLNMQSFAPWMACNLMEPPDGWL